MEPVADFDYHLPEELIAQEPLADRAGSRLLVLHRKDGRVEHRSFRDASEYLSPNDLLVLNNTRVTAVRLFGQKPTGGQVEALLLREEADDRYEALLRPGKRLPVGTQIVFPDGMAAEVLEDRTDGRKLIQFAPLPDLKGRLNRVGLAPLPPYIHLPLADRSRYQTVYAQAGGSAAAPTAGLHFTEDYLQGLRSKGVEIAEVTLSVGLDTFRPISVEDAAEHPIHGETCAISEKAAEIVNHAGGKIIGVGTTSVRTLETFATGRRQVANGERHSRLFIRPGYEFRVVDGMFTNFHMPRTTMLMMLAAMVGKDALMNAYAEAVAQRYRFLSFGDSMLII